LSPANAAKIGSASDPTRAIASKDFFTWAGKSFASVFCHFNSSRSLVRIYESNLPEIIEYVLKINAGSFSFEAANPRHEHEYHLFERMKIPEGKVLCPAPSRMPVTSSSTPPT
jgi:methionine synthase II (cobalamin-independent)